MRTYTLQASSAFKVEAVLIEAPEDSSAMLIAASEVLDRAHRDPNRPNLWSEGRITLRDPKGALINEMAHK